MEIFSSEECVICLEQAVYTTFAPCRHKCTCDACGALVRERAMPCPLCRAIITGTLQDEEHLPAMQAELDAFAKDRDEYIKKLNRPCAKNAGFVGKGRLARSVGEAMGNELERRRAETAGCERMMNAKKAVFTEKDDEALLHIDYKVGRRKLHETAPLMREWDEVRRELTELLEGDVITSVEFATHYPEVFWLWKWHGSKSLKGLVRQ